MGSYRESASLPFFNGRQKIFHQLRKKRAQLQNTESAAISQQQQQSLSLITSNNCRSRTFLFTISSWDHHHFLFSLDDPLDLLRGMHFPFTPPFLSFFSSSSSSSPTLLPFLHINNHTVIIYILDCANVSCVYEREIIKLEAGPFFVVGIGFLEDRTGVGGIPIGLHRLDEATAEIFLFLGLRIPEPRILRHVIDHLSLRRLLCTLTHGHSLQRLLLPRHIAHTRCVFRLRHRRAPARYQLQQHRVTTHPRPRLFFESLRVVV